uniref:EGF-like domain-containing protein n=1 Tax=Lepeophtheirus salmonis TaxID=72036 RepID=A0A0K2TMD2_LEPSM
MFQGEMEQMTVHDKSNSVSEQCSPTRIPLRKEKEDESSKKESSSPHLTPKKDFHSARDNDFDIIEEDIPSPFRKIHRSDKSNKSEEITTVKDVFQVSNDYLNEEYVDLDFPSEEDLNIATQSKAKKHNFNVTQASLKTPKSDSSISSPEGSGETDDEDEWSEEEGSGSGEIYELEWSSWGKCYGGVGCGSRGYRVRSARCIENDRTEECVLAGMERKQERKSCIIICDKKRGYYHRKKNYNRWIPIPKKNISLLHKNKPLLLKEMNSSRVIVCKNGGELKTILLAMKCSCPSGYTGNKCENPVCHPDGCANGGTCVEPDVCACPGGYTGARCEKAFCYPDCQNGGTCVAPFTCSCPTEVAGKYCEEFSCSPNCSNGGVCIGHNVCSCPHGYSGFNCQEQTCTLHCENGGVCTMPGNKCKCASGFYGARCHKRICLNYVATREPHHRILQKVVNIRYNTTCENGNACVKTRPEYRNFRKTIYRTVYKCADDISKKHRRKPKNANTH